MSDLISRPRIDKSRIDKNFWNFGPVLVAEKWLQDYLMEPGQFDKLCLHEGAHLYYARQLYAGAKIFAPYVSYNRSERCYEPTEGGVDTSEIDRKCDANRLLLFVKGVCAGGTAEFVCQFLDSGKSFNEICDDVGDSNDIKDFPRYCKEIREASPGLQFDDTKVWRKAQEAVITDILIPETKAQIDAIIEEVRSFLLLEMYPETLATASLNGDSSNS